MVTARPLEHAQAQIHDRGPEQGASQEDGNGPLGLFFVLGGQILLFCPQALQSLVLLARCEM